jgi:hypothetical protein
MKISRMRLHRLISARGPSRELATITSDYATENIFYTDWSVIDDVAGFAVHNRNYEPGH